MAALRAIPGAALVELDPDRPRAIFANGAAAVIACHRRRWLLFDVAGGVRVDARAVVGGATALAEGALISVGGERMRFVTGGPARRIEARRASRCAWCRDGIEAGESCLECPRCGRVHHVECAAASPRCGRCREVMES
jgi:hypothetical protein